MDFKFGRVQIQMKEFGMKLSISKEDFMINILNNLHEEYDVILIGLENHFILSGTDILIIEVICEKSNQWHKR